MIRLVAVPVAAAACLASCVAPPEPELVPTYAPIPPTDDCDDDVCGSNSPIVKGLAFAELHELPWTQVNGFSLGSFQKAGQPLIDFNVIGARVQLYTVSGPITGAAVVGTTGILQTPNGPVTLSFTDHKVIPYYNGGPGATIDGYRITYPDVVWNPETNLPETVRVDLCDYENVGDVDGNLVGNWVIFSQGDRFDEVANTISATGNEVGGYYNVSCNGDAIAKEVRTFFAKAVENFSHKTKLVERKAMLKMWTADYCGDGTKYTHRGERLDFLDLHGWHTMGELDSYEAIWTETGAYCLNTPRYVDKSEIGCVIQECSKSMLDHWKRFGYLLSANPAE